MLTDSPHSDELFSESKGFGLSKLLAGLVAVVITAILLGGYFYLRNRHARQTAVVAPAQSEAALPKGPAKVHVMVDDPMLKGSETTIGGTVRNISPQELSHLIVELELRRRKDGNVERKTVSLEPSTLAPSQEGRYSVKLPAQEYGGVRLAGVTEGAAATMLVYTSSQGQRRPLEKTEPKTITVKRPVPAGEEFINTPDNPGRVP
jgi:hypothetical protein